MMTSIMIAYPCPKCGAGQAILPSKIDAAAVVRCAQCGQTHGRLDEVQWQLASRAREEGVQRMQGINRTRPTRKFRNLAEWLLEMA
jgi:predicted Zn finger-like uncharacterized protein